MTEKLPNWNLKDFYNSYEDLQIQKDINIFKTFVASSSSNTYLCNIAHKISGPSGKTDSIAVSSSGILIKHALQP